MKQHTVQEIITNLVKTDYASGGPILDAHYQIYLFRDYNEPNLVYYVGQSGNPYYRFQTHIGADRLTLPSEVGRCLLKYAPETGKWYFEVYTLDDCRDIVLAHHAESSDYELVYGVDDAEEAFIKHYRPCFNTAMNPDPTPLPERYQEVYTNPYAAALADVWGIK
jgi:hypothetical protein